MSWRASGRCKRLGELNPLQLRIVELHFFGWLTIAEPGGRLVFVARYIATSMEMALASL
jgi:hypothetical protein